MKKKPEFLRDAVIVAAHPDDELLWFNSILHEVDEVVVVYREFWAQPTLGAARSAALADYPRGGVTCLDIDESGAHGCADWSDPAPGEYGLDFTLEAGRRELTRLAKRSLPRVGPFASLAVPPDGVTNLYRANFEAICAALRPRLKKKMNVFSHNPWGEYGHEEHVQVFRALETLREEIGFKLWMSNYCTERALPLAMRYFETAPGGYIRLPTDKAFAERVADVYKKHECWTWADDWAWFDEECFMEAPRGRGTPAQPQRHLFPLNLFTIDTAHPRKWLPIAVSASAASAAIGATLAETI